MEVEDSTTSFLSGWKIIIVITRFLSQLADMFVLGEPVPYNHSNMSMTGETEALT